MPMLGKWTSSSRIRRYSLVVLLAWTLLVLGSLWWQIVQHRAEALQLGKMQCQAYFDKDVLYRRWASLHGGVYVPVTAATRPNPYLSHIPERDIVTPSGRQLTLMNPAYMTRQVFEMAREYTGTGRGHITSLKPIRKENAPDAWEKRVLASFEQGADHYGEIAPIDGKPYYRYMKRLTAERPCLKCHAAQGYREGEVRGGLSVSISMEPYQALMRASVRQECATHAFAWLLFTGFIGFGARKLDRSDSRLREQSEFLKREKQRSDQYLSVAQVIMVAFDDQARITLLNRKGHEVLGYADGELEGRNWFKTCLAPEEYEQVFAVYRRLMAGELEPVAYYENHVLTKRGEKRLIAWRNTFMKDASGKTVGTLSSGEDITERRRAEDALAEREAMLRQIHDTSSVAIFLMDKSCRIVHANAHMAEMFRCPPEELTGREYLELVHPCDREIGRQVIGSLLAGEIPSADLERHYARSDGTDFWGHLSSKLFYDGKGTCQGMLAVIADITGRKLVEEEREKLEQQLHQSQKMEAIGQLAGGVAHDFNNLLTVIIGYANLLGVGKELDPQQSEATEQIIAASEKASQLTRGLLAFSRKQALFTQSCNLNEVVHNVEKFLARIIGEDIQLKSIRNLQKIPVRVDRSQIEQTLINLATNARDAMPKGGLLTVETDVREIEAGIATGVCQPGPYACITVSDNGQGMDRETSARVFEPFFTTKEVGKGTGLGMAIVFGIVRQHKGFINVYSEPGIGTTFRIYLPLAQAEPADDAGNEVKEAPRGGTETILLAEDDANVSKLVTTVLENFGYTVIQAEDGQVAVEKFCAHRGEVQLLLLDMIMPRKSGKEAYQEISRMKPGVRVLYSSGYTADFMQSRGVEEEGIELIMKPVQPMELLRKIREMLDAG